MIYRKLIILMLFFTVITFAGNTGKISGKVIDGETGEVLIGVNILIKGTLLGAATDEKGEYYILQIPPGKYDVEFRYVGYQSVTVKDVVVRVDLTTELNATLNMQSTEMETVVIQAEKKMVHKDITSTKRTSSREDMEKMPGMEQALDVLQIQGGAVLGVGSQTLQLANGTQLQVRDESIKDIHLRGGRGGEILYMVDGIPVNHPIYGGRSVLDLNVVDVDEIELLTGGFNAEYGQAQSGVVNITTRSGKSFYEGGVEYKTDYGKVFGPSYGTHYSSIYVGGPEPITSQLLPMLGIELPGNFNIFLSSNGTLTNTTYDNGRTRERINIGGIEFDERQDNTGNLNGKIDWTISPTVRLAFSYHGSWKSWSRFDWMWKNYPDNTVSYNRENSSYTLKFNHTLSNSTFYNLSIGYLGVQYSSSLFDKEPYQYWRFYKDDTDSVGYDYDTWTKLFGEQKPHNVLSTIKAPTVDELTGFFNNQGYENLWRDDITKTLTIRGDITSQITKDHLLKGGVELQYHDISYIDIQDGGVTLSNYGRWKYGIAGNKFFNPPPGPYPEFGQNRWVFDAYPLIGAFFLQDKFERESIIINAGVRFDWFMPGETVFKDAYKKQWEAATGLDSDWKKFRYKVSPRFGISFPITTEMVAFFSYGHFNQLPELQFMYRDPYSGGVTGNPHLDYEQTVLYEFGFTQQVFDDWSFDIKSYTKDISQQVGTTGLKAALGVPVALYDNKGYARARGIEFQVKKRYSGFTSGSVTYTAQWADGYSSSAFDDYIRSITSFPNPIRERRLNWDVRHQVIFEGSIIVPYRKNVELFGLTLPDDWNITVLSRFSSGYPYTPGSNDLIELQTKENTGTGPVTSSTDLKFEKRFRITDKTNLTFVLDIFNIFDQNNIQIGYGFNTWTGKPFAYGDTIADQKQHFSWYDMFRLRDPRQFTTGRYAKFGLKFDF